MHPKAGLFSAVLTAFIIDRNQSIEPTPAAASAFYQQQSVVLLNQISQQLSSLGAPIPDPSDSLLPDFALSPSASDVRVNIIWINSLVFSLTSALFATLIRQRVRDPTSIFQANSPLVVARLRQYLFERLDYIPNLTEVVTGLVHLSLLLFLAGLADFLLNTYTSVGRFTLFAVVFCATLYTVTTVTPVMRPQSSYCTPFSPLVWFMTRRLWTRWINDATDLRRRWTRLSSIMVRGQKQLAMEYNAARKHRDTRAIRWLVNNLQDLESLILGLPGSFDTTWGVKVWKDVPEDEKVKLFEAIRRLFETCRDRGSFKSEDEWRVRSQACTETLAVCVLFMDADIGMVRNLRELLSDIGGYGRTRKVAEMSHNPSFTI